MSKVLILIPSRMSAQRLPGKPLLEINNLPIISHVVNRGKETELGEVIVCTENEEIAFAVKKNGGKAVLTGSHHKNGTERIYEGLQKLKKENVTYVISLQGDEPAINPEDIKNLYSFMIQYNADIGTLASEIKEDFNLKNKNVVKVKTDEKLKNNNFVNAINFSRDDISKESSNIYHHIGIYCYKSSILKKFVNLKQTKNEIKNRLEQLRVIDNDIKINVALAKSSPIGVDTKEDYIALKKIMEYKS
jgi:3-deoxy-manno-octulosonate cytidylyltransferase (CMP-KDO synthetase)